MTRRYIVVFELDVEADSHIEAGEKAWSEVGNYRGNALVRREDEPTGLYHNIDLEDCAIVETDSKLVLAVETSRVSR